MVEQTVKERPSPSPKQGLQFLRWEDVQRKDLMVLQANLPGTMPATAGNYSVFFNAYKPIIVTAVMESHQTLGTDAGAVTLNIEKLLSGQAPGAGVDLLVTGFSLKSTINTSVLKRGTDFQRTTKSSDGVFATTLSPMDRLALHLTGTPTAVASLSVTIFYMGFNRGDYFV